MVEKTVTSMVILKIACLSKNNQKFRASVFINMAAITDVDFCEDNKELAYKVNTEFPLLVSKILKSTKNKYYIIQISTDQVYSGIGPHKNQTPIL